MRLCNRSIDSLKKLKTYYNDYELSTDLYSKGRTRHHYGKAALEAFLVNSYNIQPLIDPDIKKIKFNIIKLINQIYNNKVYNWAKKFSIGTNFHPLRHGYGLFAIAKTLEDLSLNKRFIKNSKSQKEYKEVVMDKIIN